MSSGEPVEAANLAFYRALEARSLSAMELVWWHDESVTCIHPGWHRLDGWTEVRRSWENIFANSRAWTVACEETDVRVAGEVAWVRCVEVIRPFGIEGDAAAARMQATNVFERRHGEWKMVHHHASASAEAEAEEGEMVN